MEIKKIIIVDSSSDKNIILEELFTELSVKGCELYFLTGRNKIKLQFGRHLYFKNVYLGENSKNPIFVFFYIILRFGLKIISFFYFLYLKQAYKIEILVCIGWNAKIIFSPIARFLGLKTIIIEKPETRFDNLSKMQSFVFKRSVKKSRVGVFNQAAKGQLERIGISEEQIIRLSPAIKLNQYNHQDTIFSEIAQTEGEKFKRKFFSVGVIVDLNKEQNIEKILQAVKKCIEVIPSLQLIIVGEGDERKNLSWAAKKMEIENIVWFVGAQSHLRKWLDSFDVYLAGNKVMRMEDIKVVLQAMSAELPVICPEDPNFENIIIKDKTGCFVDTFDSEMIARQIIKLYQDAQLRSKIGRLAKEKVEENFSIVRQVEEFEKIL